MLQWTVLNVKIVRVSAIIQAGGLKVTKMEPPVQKADDSDNFTKTPVPLSKSPSFSPSVRNMTRTVIVSLVETVTHDITYGESHYLKCKYLRVGVIFVSNFLNESMSIKCFFRSTNGIKTTNSMELLGSNCYF